MIIDSLDHLSLYEKAFPSLVTVQKILSSENLLEKEVGSYSTEDANCRYNICEYNTTDQYKDFEIHKKEADVQIMLTGNEFMVASKRDSAKDASPSDSESDIHFVGGPHIVSFRAEPGYFAIFFPGEPHAPGLALDKPQGAKKVVFKLKM